MNAGRRWGGLAFSARALGWGLLLGLGLVCAVLGVYTALGWFDVQGMQAVVPGVNVPDDFERWNFFARSVGWQVIQSLWEAAFLCLLTLGLRRALPLPVAALGASLVFGLTHRWNPHATPLTCLNVAAVVGLPACAVYLWARSYWATFGFHFAWNLLLGPVFGVIVAGHPRFGLLASELAGPGGWTGGLYGPEGGLLALLANGAAALTLLWAATRRAA